MQKRIRLSAIVTSLISLAFFMAVCVLWVNESFTKTVKDDLNNFLKSAIYLTGDIPDDADAYAKALAANYSSDMRITVIDPEGNVLGDSDGNFTEMGLHHSRQEVIKAKASGYGDDLRKSETSGKATLYVARHWKEGYVIRGAIPFTPSAEFIKNVFPAFMGSFVVGLIAVVYFSKRTAKKTAEGVERFTDALTRAVDKLVNNEEAVIEDIEIYEEFRPIVSGYEILSEKLYEYIKNLNGKQQEIEKILSSMEEGLIILDGDFNILASNNVGLETFNITELNVEYNIIHLFRDEAFISALNSVKETGKSVSFDLKTAKGSEYRIYISAVIDGGYVILTDDVSQIKSLERIRTEFSANVSHELKTPITSISGFAELINKGMVTDPEKIKEYCYKIYNESQRLIALIDDIIKLSEIESMNLCEKEVISAKDIFNNAVDILGPKAESKGIKIHVEGNGRFLLRYNHFVELTTNLLDNAIKYNKDGGQVNVIIFEDEEVSGFTVKDTGIGIPKEHQERIFERFYRVDKGRNKKIEGTGLGLSIVKHIVLSYGGDIDLKSSEKGTEITVKFKK